MDKNNPPFSRKPPQEKDALSADEFINAAEEHKLSAKNPEKKSRRFPWNSPKLREDVCNIFNLRIPERDFQKLKYLSKKSGDSMHKLCIDSLLPEINRKLDELDEK